MSTQNLWCVGRNYADHAKELQNEIPSAPLIFLKSGACLNSSSQIQLPTWARDIHHEIELVLQLNDQLEFENIGLGLDLTERTLQSQLKAKGQPWTLAKSFINSAPISPLIPLAQLNQNPFQEWWEDLQMSLSVNSHIRQTCSASQMIFDPFTLLEFIKKHFPIQPRDLIFTGTPAGVAALKSNDQTHSALKLKEHVKLEWDVHFY